ncbi:hypothetical protein F6X40_17650 [Paraburkholderia sp. UCT31]|uniref:hypothetical protein n=1 Tax=Paraburkholderia sp. UCT31 TaxID=2615209 RepID=UPI001654FE70|nr:hypothetical protein [Paraburkholderia sp. UCT31]MBC8738586.1 hypothetical protein [Paraburkholderia sp. UCT31]
MNEISFRIRGADADVPSGETESPADAFAPGTIDVLVDGLSLLRQPDGYVFDAATVLALRATPSPNFFPFTCGCGVPGCIGIHTPAVMVVESDTVTWTFPEKPFRETLAAEAFGSEGPLQLRFDRALYVAALDNLQGHLEEVRRARGRNMNIWPGYPDEDLVTAPLQQVLAKQRKRHLDWDAREAWRERVWGDALGTDLVIAFESGNQYSIPLENLADSVASHRLSQDRYARRWATARKHTEFIESRLAPTLRSGLEAVVREARSVPWEILVEDVFSDGRQQQREKDVVAEGKTWPEASFRLRTYEQYQAERRGAANPLAGAVE